MYMFRAAILSFSVIAIVLGGCTSGADPTEDFLGTWTRATGSYTVTCGNNTESGGMGGMVRFEEGVTAPLIVSDPDCTFNFDMQADEATVVLGQSCALNGKTSRGSQYTVVIAPTEWLFSPRDDTNMSERGTSTMTYHFTSGEITTCVFSHTASLTKIAH
jgi:hypothetical protein